MAGVRGWVRACVRTGRPPAGTGPAGGPFIGSQADAFMPRRGALAAAAVLLWCSVVPLTTARRWLTCLFVRRAAWCCHRRPHCRRHDCNPPRQVCEGLSFRAYPAGHVLGAVMIHLTAGAQSVVYTGECPGGKGADGLSIKASALVQRPLCSTPEQHVSLVQQVDLASGFCLVLTQGTVVCVAAQQ